MATRRKAAPRARFVKLSSTGRELAPTAKKWAQVLDRKTGLIWTAETIGPRVDHAKAKEATEAVRIGKKKWRLPTIKELLSLVDYERYSPAIDTGFFRCETSWYWTSTAAASSPGDCAWHVDFGYGNSVWLGRNYTGFVRAVRSARASQ
jgi:hypothetical protein